jgi:hypothetical protein
MSRAALAILEALQEASPLTTPDLRRAASMQAPDRTADFDRAMAELQRGLWIVKIEEVYDPDFSYRWDLLDDWLPNLVEASRRLERKAAAEQLVVSYLRSAAASQSRFLASLFPVGPPEVEAALSGLEANGHVHRDQRIRGLPGSWVVWQGSANRRD